MSQSEYEHNELLNVAFLGGGIDSAVGTSHFTAIELDKQFRVVAGCFSRIHEINLASGVRHRIDPKRIYPTLESMLSAEKNTIDVVVVLTPTDQHYNHVKLILEEGFPVICEKSLTTTVSESQELVSLVEQKSGFLSVIFNYTGYPLLREIREFIRHGKLGHLHQMNVEMPQEGFLRIGNDMKPMRIQDWRLRSNVEIPIVSLDLGVHLHSIIAFLTEESPLSTVSLTRSIGNFEEIEDNVMALVKYTNNLDINMWYGKSALGYRNGLKVELFGSLGTISWIQENPEVFIFSDGLGNRRIYDRGCSDLTISRQDRYQRFKAGHPSGFIEALANYYFDIAIALREFKKNGASNFYPMSEIFNSSHALEGMKLMEAIHTSSKNSQWVDIIPST